MNEKQVKNALGAATGIVFLLLLARATWIGQPLTDRTLVIFAVLLWAYLQVDISAALPFVDLNGGGSNPNEGEED